MPKSIVFCADGTWNGPGEPDGPVLITNVLKLYRNLLSTQADPDKAPEDPDKAPEQEKSLSDGDGVSQVAKYLHGVGDSKNVLARWAQGSLGLELIGRLLRGYTFVSRNWQPGDRIQLIGFSRGAYTVRALAGLITACGLLDLSDLARDDRQTAYCRAAAVWHAHRREVFAQHPEGILATFENWIAELPGVTDGAGSVKRILNVPIATVAVWDTVGALGIPDYEKDKGRVDLLRFADTVLSPNVAHGVQALAVDEQREDFTPTFWDADKRIDQCLFPGAHSDVGGGYPPEESGLSDAAFAWLLGRFAPEELVLNAELPFPPHPDATAEMHRPWEGGVIKWQVGPRKFDRDHAFGLSRALLKRLHAGAIGTAGQAPALYTTADLTDYLEGIDPKPWVKVWETDEKLASSAP